MQDVCIAHGFQLSIEHSSIAIFKLFLLSDTDNTAILAG